MTRLEGTVQSTLEKEAQLFDREEKESVEASFHVLGITSRVFLILCVDVANRSPFSVASLSVVNLKYVEILLRKETIVLLPSLSTFP